MSDYSNLEIVYVPGSGDDFVIFIKTQGDKATWVSVDGHARWVVTREDGTQYIARPWGTKPQ